jgi:hypothetical protein
MEYSKLLGLSNLGRFIELFVKVRVHIYTGVFLYDGAFTYFRLNYDNYLRFNNILSEIDKFSRRCGAVPPDH